MPLESPRAALQDISWRSNVAATPGEFVIPQEDVAVAAQSCRSRRNLAARLATAIFPPHERAGSNCRGVLGKTALNGLKVKAIYTTSLQHFRLSDLRPGLWRRKTCATLLTRCVVRRRLWLCRDLKKTFPNADYLPCTVALFLYTYISYCTVCYTEDSVGAYVRKLFETKVPTSWLSRVLHEIDVHICSQSGRRRSQTRPRCLRTGRRRLQTWRRCFTVSCSGIYGKR